MESEIKVQDSWYLSTLEKQKYIYPDAYDRYQRFIDNHIYNEKGFNWDKFRRKYHQPRDNFVKL